MIKWLSLGCYLNLYNGKTIATFSKYGWKDYFKAVSGAWIVGNGKTIATFSKYGWKDYFKAVSGAWIVEKWKEYYYNSS